MAELVIRKATEKDIEGIEALEKICFKTPWSRDSIKHDIVDNKMATYIVAAIGENIVGYIGVWCIIDEGHITNVAVSPVYRRQHIGTLLVDTLIKSTENAGIVRHTLEVRASNVAAKKLYENFGFKESGVRKGYYEDNGEDAILMWRN